MHLTTKPSPLAVPLFPYAGGLTFVPPKHKMNKRSNRFAHRSCCIRNVHSIRYEKKKEEQSSVWRSAMELVQPFSFFLFFVQVKCAKIAPLMCSDIHRTPDTRAYPGTIADHACRAKKATQRCFRRFGLQARRAQIGESPTHWSAHSGA